MTIFLSGGITQAMTNIIEGPKNQILNKDDRRVVAAVPPAEGAVEDMSASQNAQAEINNSYLRHIPLHGSDGRPNGGYKIAPTRQSE